MDPRNVKRKMFDAQSQSRIENTAQLAGLSAAFGQIVGELGPQWMDLQTTLAAGLVRSQHYESRRLAARYGEDDERTQLASARAQLFGAYETDLQQRTETATRVVQTFQIDGIFHGYVAQADGSDAVGYAVQLTLLDATGGKRVLRKSAKTDDSGYFRIELQDATTNEASGGIDMQSVVDRVGKALAHEHDAAAEQSPDAATAHGGAAQGNGTANSQVQVFDVTGRLVYDDPNPPTFDGVASEFRYYALAEQSAAKVTAGVVRRRTQKR